MKNKKVALNFLAILLSIFVLVFDTTSCSYADEGKKLSNPGGGNPGNPENPIAPAKCDNPPLSTTKEEV